METRFNYTEDTHRPAIGAMYALEAYIRHSSLEKTIVELVKDALFADQRLRLLHRHAHEDARAAGETEGRLYGLSAWRETPYYTARERAALAWAEALTRIAGNGLPEATYEDVRSHFNEDEIVTLTFVVITINAWNRLAIASAMLPGSYQTKTHAA